MSDEKTTITGSSTMGVLLNSNYGNAPETPSTPETPAAPIVNNETTVVPDTPLVVTGEGNLQPEVQQTQPALETNESSFSIGFEEIPATVNAPQTAAQPMDWREAIKTVDKKELAKELGISEFALEINEHLSRGGSAMDYLNAKAIDYTKIPHANLVMDNFKKQYPSLPADKLQKLFDAEYKQGDLVPEDEREIGLIRLEADAENIRTKRIAEQQQFKMPETSPIQQNEKLTQFEQKETQRLQELQANTTFLANNEYVKNLLQSKRVAVDVGDGAKPFNFNVDKPEVLVKAIVDGTLWKRIISNEKGELDVERLIDGIRYMANPKQHNKDIFNYGKSFGVQKLMDEGHNAKKPDGVVSTQQISEADVWKTPREGKVGNHVKRNVA